MNQWGNTDTVGNSVSWAAETIQAGSGKVAIAANNVALYNNTTPNAFISGQTIGQFGVSRNEMANTDGEGSKVHAPGWALRRVGQGGIIGLTVSEGSGFQNGETLVVSNGTANATGVLTTNATGNLVSVSFTDDGQFPNTSVLVYTFTHEKHVVGFNIDADGTGYDNTDYIVVSNSISDGRGTINTDASGNITAVVVTNAGLFDADAANGDVVVSIYAANGGTSNGSDATITANLVASSGGAQSAPVLGGRAGRVTYETLVVVKEITSGTGDDALLPNT